MHHLTSICSTGRVDNGFGGEEFKQRIQSLKIDRPGGCRLVIGADRISVAVGRARSSRVVGMLIVRGYVDGMAFDCVDRTRADARTSPISPSQMSEEMHRILIVDDEPQMRISLRETLEMAGYRVSEAGDGMEAIDYMSDTKPDVLVTDIIMPEKEGIATIREFRSLYPDLPIIAISGAGSTPGMDFLELAGRLGADRMLAKPFGPHELLNTVREVLGNS